MLLFTGFFVSLFIAVLIAIKLMQIRQLERENIFIQNYMQSMEAFYETVQGRIEAVRRYRHDLAKHIQTLEKLMKNSEKNKELREYADSLMGKYKELRQQEYCIDEVVNSVISVEKQQCENRGISFLIQVEPVSYDEIQAIDKVGLLHNLLDNAIEANEKPDQKGKKGICLSMGKKQDEIWIEVQNTVQPGSVVTLKTSKEDKHNHGIGTKIIDSIIQKYDGRKEMESDLQKGVFRKKVYLKAMGTECLKRVGGQNEDRNL